MGMISYYSFSKETNMPHISGEKKSIPLENFLLVMPVVRVKANHLLQWQHFIPLSSKDLFA